ncbi:oxysterol-binding protein-related protein 4C isoform X2 [Medicago truncatula]|uniref:OSBP(Oxysterol-binding protein)-related protein 4C n=1 Tax=Medicago truncatula TaxID=3880 RepID=G7JUB4_MEDTR|nr:oxysterol-binding protein-related protein 4C isoform X2 [Medicago truncatula]AES92259.1 OSBP(oxysterol-binding protein)-related protein 4C [Medicago truncatula]
METNVVLTKPFTIDHNKSSDSNGNYKAPIFLQQVLSLFKNVQLGSDLSRFKLPPTFNMPKSQLQWYGECVYSTGVDLINSINNGKTPLDRFISVVAWSISTTRPQTFGVVPYNPILAETHHVSKGNLNVLLEQVSHHPQVSALHATDRKGNIDITLCHSPLPKFVGTGVEVDMHGKRHLHLHNHGETYEMNCPNFLFRFLPIPGIDWVGNVTIRCLETGLVAELSYIRQSFFGFGSGNRRRIKGKIFDSLTKNVLYKVDGHWDSTVILKDATNNAEVRVIYDAKEVLSGLHTPFVKDPESVWQTESALVWGELSQAIISNNWGKAREAKNTVEETQRIHLRERESKGETWVPKYFTVTHSKEDGWKCSPIQKWVPDAPIATL